MLTNLSPGLCLPYPKAEPALSVACAILNPRMRVARAAFFVSPLCLRVIQRYKTVPRVVKRGGRFGGDLTKWGSPSIPPPKGGGSKRYMLILPPSGELKEAVL